MERLRKRIEKTVYNIKGQEYRITVSAGISKFETYMNSVMDAFDRADQALYASKEDGRNRCTYYNDIKNRLSTDANKLRQELLKVKEENRSLKEQANKKRPKNKKEEKVETN